MAKKITQKQMVFTKLYLEFKKDPDRLIPIFEFVGEMEIPQFKRWVLMSYKCPARLTEIFQENPDLLHREWIKGKSGARYYGYKIKKTVQSEDVQEKTVKDIYESLKRASINPQPVQEVVQNNETNSAIMC